MYPDAPPPQLQEGALPHLVRLMSPAASGSSPRLQDQAHAARLVALLSQATPTHGLMASQGVLEALVRVVASGTAAAAPRPRGKLMAALGGAGVVEWKAGGAVISGHTWPQLQFWQQLRQQQEGEQQQQQEGGQQQRLKQGGDDHGGLESAATLSIEEEGSIKVEEESSVVQSEQQQQQPLEPELVAVMKHAASALSVLAQNPDLHYKLVSMGAVPAMVKLLGTGVCMVLRGRRITRSQGQCLLIIKVWIKVWPIDSHLPDSEAPYHLHAHSPGFLSSPPSPRAQPLQRSSRTCWPSSCSSPRKTGAMPLSSLAQGPSPPS